MGLRPTRVNENQRRDGRRHAKERHVCATQIARCDFQEPKATKDLRSLLKEQLRGFFARNDRVHVFFRSL